MYIFFFIPSRAYPFTSLHVPICSSDYSLPFTRLLTVQTLPSLHMPINSSEGTRRFSYITPPSCILVLIIINLINSMKANANNTFQK